MKQRFSLARSAPSHDEDTLPPLAAHPAIVELTAKIAAFEIRLAETVTRRQRAVRSNTAAKPKATALERAELLAAGGTIPSAEPNAEIRAADVEENILRAAILDLHAQKAEIESRESYLASLQFQDRHIAALRRIDAALGDAFEGMKELYAIVETLRNAGYAPSGVALPANIPAAFYTLGDPANPVGQAAQFRGWLLKTFGEKK